MKRAAHTYPDGTIYEGEWKDGKRHGKGIWTRPDRSLYVGEWQNDKPHGSGMLSMANGKKFVGEWRDGKRHGLGLDVEPRGTSTFGTWKEGVLLLEKQTPLPQNSGRQNQDKGKPENKPWLRRWVILVGALVVLALILFMFLSNGSAPVVDPTPALIPDEQISPSEGFQAGTIGNLEIGDRVVDSNWNWAFKNGPNYTEDELGVIKIPVVWIVVGKNHFEVEGNEPHVTLLAENLIAQHVFDNSSNRGHKNSGCNHWGESGTPDATHGLRTFLNNTFYESMSDQFRNAVINTVLQNDTCFYSDYKWGSTWRPYTTIDQVFILSSTELGSEINLNDGNVLPYFDLNHPLGPEDVDWLRESWLAHLLEERQEYFTRTPERGLIRGHTLYKASFNPFIAKSSGEISGYATAAKALGVRPALNIRADAGVSSSPNANGVYELSY